LFIPTIVAGQGAAAASQVAERSVIIVSGHAETMIPANRATVRIAVDARGETAALAGAENARIQEAVLVALGSAGVASTQIATAGYTVAENLRPVGPDRTPQRDGYVARNAVHVELTALDRIGTVIDAALAAGANRIDGVLFTATQTDSARRVALTAAIANARRDAEAMARAAGGTLGRLLELSTEPAPPGVFGYRAAAGAATRLLTTEVAPREVRVNATVVARWEFHAAP
jgi:hypothetical protein